MVLMIGYADSRSNPFGGVKATAVHPCVASGRKIS